MKQARHEVLGHRRHAELVSHVVEGIGVALEQGDVGVHSRSGVVGEGLGHEGGLDALEGGDLPNDHAEGHDVVSHRQRIGVTQVDLVLAGSGLVVAELHRDTHPLQDVDGVTTEIGTRPQGGVVEIAAIVEGDRCSTGLVFLLEQVELDLRMHVEGEPHVSGPGHRLLENVTRICCRGRAVGIGDIAEHPSGAGARAPRQHLEGGRVRMGHHVCLVDAGVTLNSRTVETDAFGKSTLDLSGGDGDGLE